MNVGFTNLGDDIVSSILGFVRAEDCGKFARCCNDTNKLTKGAFLTELLFSGKVNRRTITQHAPTLKILEIPNMECIRGIDLPNLEQLLVSREVLATDSDFSIYPKLNCLGIVAFGFPKIPALTVPNTLEYLYTTYQLSAQQIESIENDCKLKTLLVYRPNLSICSGNTKKFINPNKSFMIRWGDLEDRVGRCCMMFSFETEGMSGMHQEYPNGYDNHYDSDDDNDDDSDDGDYNLAQYNADGKEGDNEIWGYQFSESE
jgi:hypothetical protein